jgi:hypothetical protein
VKKTSKRVCNIKGCETHPTKRKPVFKKVGPAEASLKNAILGVAKRASKKPVVKMVSPTDAAWKRIWADFNKQYRTHKSRSGQIGQPGWPTQRKMFRAAVERELREGGPVGRHVLQVRGGM